MAESVRSSLPNGGAASSRHEKSLGLLTIKFVTLLQEAKDGVLDLKVVSCRSLLLLIFFTIYAMLCRCFSPIIPAREIGVKLNKAKARS